MSQNKQGIVGAAWDKFKKRDDIICPNPNCGYQGTPKFRSSFSYIIFIPLLCLGVIPGLIYMAVTNGVKVHCPKCNVQVGTK